MYDYGGFPPLYEYIYGGGLNTSDLINRVFAFGVESLCISSVNCFVLITGYYMADTKRIKVSRAVDVYLSMIIYNLLFFFISCVTGEYSFNIKDLIGAVVPFLKGRKWFVEAYIILLFLVPFINKLFSNLSKRAFRVLLGIQLTLFCLWPSFLPSAPITDHGYGIINFLTLYTIAAYIKKHVVIKERKKAVKISLIVSLLSVFAICVSSITPYLRNRAWDYCYIFVIITSVAMFMLFLNLEEFHSSRINAVSSLTFGVYLSHATIFLQNTIYRRIMNVDAVLNTPLFIPHFISCVLLQFAFFALLEWLRQRIWGATVGRFCSGKLVSTFEARLNGAISE